MPKAPARKRYCASKENDDTRYLSANLVNPMSHFFTNLTGDSIGTNNPSSKKCVETVSIANAISTTLDAFEDKKFQDKVILSKFDNDNIVITDGKNPHIQESCMDILPSTQITQNTQTHQKTAISKSIRAKIDKFLAQESSDWQALQYGLFVDLGTRLITIGPCLIVDEWWCPAIHDVKCTASCTEIPNLPLIRCRATQVRVLLNFDHSLLEDYNVTKKEEESLREKVSTLRRIYGGTATDYFYKTNFIHSKSNPRLLDVSQCLYNNLWIQFVPSGWINDYPLVIEDMDESLSNINTGRLYATRVFRIIREDGSSSIEHLNKNK